VAVLSRYRVRSVYIIQKSLEHHRSHRVRLWSLSPLRCCSISARLSCHRKSRNWLSRGLPKPPVGRFASEPRNQEASGTENPCLGR